MSGINPSDFQPHFIHDFDTLEISEAQRRRRAEQRAQDQLQVPQYVPSPTKDVEKSRCSTCALIGTTSLLVLLFLLAALIPIARSLLRSTNIEQTSSRNNFQQHFTTQTPLFVSAGGSQQVEILTETADGQLVITQPDNTPPAINRPINDDPSIVGESHSTIGDQTRFRPTAPITTTRRPPSADSCAAGTFLCGTQCLGTHLRCNKRKDCPTLLEDELNCSCRDILANLAPHKLCDLYSDCADGGDEQGCAKENCDEGYFRCGLGRRQCVPKRKVCDSRQDCLNGEDEQGCLTLQSDLKLIADPGSAKSLYQSSSGYLLYNFRGEWYPVCGNQFTQEQLKSVCEAAGYDSTGATYDHDLPTSFIPPGSRMTYIEFIDVDTPQIRDRCVSTYPVRVNCSNNMLTCPVPPEAQQTHCKRSSTRVVGGQNAGLGCHPYVAALYEEGQQKCMAVVLNQEWLLTAAHCFGTPERRNSYWVARFGFSRQLSQSSHEEIRVISSVILHPSYQPSPIETHDLALLRLDRPLQFSPYIRPSCLPQPRDFQPSTIAEVLGWGFVAEDRAKPVDELQKATLQLLSPSECNSTNAFSGKIQASAHLCATTANPSQPADACSGDSGGPLLVDDVVVGLTSTGFGCARDNTPGVYTRLDTYTDWLRRTLQTPAAQMPVGQGSECSNFRCRLGDCIFDWLRCDGHHDCTIDGSDEMNCTQT